LAAVDVGNLARALATNARGWQRNLRSCRLAFSAIGATSLVYPVADTDQHRPSCGSGQSRSMTIDRFGNSNGIPIWLLRATGSDFG